VTALRVVLEGHTVGKNKVGTRQDWTPGLDLRTIWRYLFDI
jgi:hypothetical protein